MSSDGADWLLLNASPEIRQQIESFAPLHPRAARDSPIAGIALTNGDLDHCLGLLSLRESHPLHVYATAAVASGFREGNAFARTLERFPGQLTWHTLELGKRCPVLASGRPIGLELEAVPLPGKLPIHLERARTPSAEDNVGLLVHEPASGKRLAYFSGVGGDAPALRAALAGAHAIFFDGTFFSSDELSAQGLSEKRAEDMAHWPLSGARGSLALLAELAPARRVLIHINNTNPILREDSAEAASVRTLGIEIAYDGLEVAL